MEFIEVKNIVYKTKNTNWFGSDYNMNIYRGCSHGCIYCDSRSECYGISEFNKVLAKKDALEIIKSNLKQKKLKGVVATGSMSDPYNPLEEKLELTRNALKLLNAYGFGAAIATKSSLVTRDIDVLKKINSHSPVIVKITITCASDELSKLIEPNVCSASQRLEALNLLSKNGIYCGVLLMPILPFITDNTENIFKILELAKEAGANFVHPAFGVTLRDRQRTFFYEKLDEIKYFNGIKEKYINKYNTNYQCTSPNFKTLNSDFKNKCKQLNLLYSMKDIIHSYKTDYTSQQLSLFDGRVE